MAIEYDNKTQSFDIQCDECHDIDNFIGLFTDCVTEARNVGWIVYKNDQNEWEHYCSERCFSRNKDFKR